MGYLQSSFAGILAKYPEARIKERPWAGCSFLKPEVIVPDEPTSAFDISVQAQILNLLKDVAEEVGRGYLLISHNSEPDSVRMGLMGKSKLKPISEFQKKNWRHLCVTKSKKQ